MKSFEKHCGGLKRAAAVVASVTVAASAFGQFEGEIKSPRPLPVMADIKTPAPAPILKLSKPSVRSINAPAAAPRKPVAMPPALANIESPKFQNVFWDVAEDGALWARGVNYKARFDAGGMTYIPFTGSDAPRNFPVRFGLRQMTIGGEPVALQAPAGAVREGDRVTIDRGDVVEVYEVRPDSIEQLFVFDVLAKSGEITLQVDAATDLGKTADGDVLKFSTARGGVTYTHAIALDAADARTPAATALRDGGIEIVVPADFAASAALPLVVDPIISTFSPEVTADEAVIADVAYDATTDSYFVTWEQNFSDVDGDVYCNTYNNIGQSNNTFTIVDFTTDNWRNPSCANNNIANNFLIAAEVGFAPNRVIKARTRAAGSTTISNVFVISGGEGGDKHNAVVGGDPHPSPPTYYCVAWQRDLSAADTDIHARLVDASGSPIGATPIFLSNSGASLDGNPAISKSNGLPPAGGQAWTIVWERSDPQADTDIFGGQIAWDGAIIHTPFIIDAASTDDRNPSVSTVLDATHNGPRPYMVAYDEATAEFARDIYACVFLGDTIITGVNLTELQGVRRQQDQRTPAVDSDGEKFIVAHNEMYDTDPGDYDVMVSSFCLMDDALVNTEYRRVIAGHLYLEKFPAIASVHAAGGADTAMLLAWQYNSPVGNGNIGAGFYRSRPICGCPADITPESGVVNIDDLLVVITWWGASVPNVPADINGDQVVDINDLLLVISSWGFCPN